MNMLATIPHQKFYFYHLPTRGRAGIKLGYAWYVSNVSIIYEVFMLLYYPSWMFNGLYYALLYYFGTNLLTQSPVPVSVFPLFQCFTEKEYQTESKRNETFGSVIFGTNVIQETWSWSQGGHEGAPPTGRAPYLVGPSSIPRPTSFTYISPYTLKPSKKKIYRKFRRCKPL